MPTINAHQSYMQPPPESTDELQPDIFQFGEKSEYWGTYDKLAGTYDKDMLGRLNSNLDNLLIFVSALRSK